MFIKHNSFSDVDKLTHYELMKIITYEKTNYRIPSMHYAILVTLSFINEKCKKSIILYNTRP